ncbi:SRPBCC family protein [Phreatobacter stygius]|uniref:SRPBCC family protein n=1 Tax=Phreatobacter stygius TaxID=1940610 RepID=A0A4D7B4V6_9HYPH|nr:SRPBCC family protein [Phreatobacter stygius]QCI65498.1 SRPBCC family protein [Phreatobacter stygius]
MSDHGIVTEAGVVVFRRVLPGPIERVWAYLTEADKRGTWLASGEMDLRVGGKAELFFDHQTLTPHKETIPEKYEGLEKGHVNHGRITRVDPPYRLSFLWDSPEPTGSEVSFELAEQGPDVLLVLTHRRLKDQAEMCSVASGWHTHLGILVDKLNGRVPQPFWATHAVVERDYEKRI